MDCSCPHKLLGARMEKWYNLRVECVGTWQKLSLLFCMN
jgi:hypothetical protein